MKPAPAVIEQLQLTPHPEGGWYRETHRSREILTTARGPRAALTSIYYLLEAGQFSRWHVVASDEVWHFQDGAPLELLVYRPSTRELHRHLFGTPTMGHELHCAVPAGDWQAARSLGENSRGDWTLSACDVGPGFDFEDFQFIAALPEHAAHFEGRLAPYRALL